MDMYLLVRAREEERTVRMGKKRMKIMAGFLFLGYATVCGIIHANDIELIYKFLSYCWLTAFFVITLVLLHGRNH